MRFISPKTDFAFKKIFGSKESGPILISFLNAILHDGQPAIASLEIIDPYSIPRLKGMKDTYLDVRAQMADGDTVLIEMQVLNLEGFEKRILYNAAKEYANQLQKSADYKALRPVIALTITDFTMFADPTLDTRVINRFALIEKEKLIEYPEGDVELVFAELPKFTTPLDELETISDKWLYFLKEAGDLDVAPESLTQVPEIERAFEMAEFAKLSREEERALQKKLEWLADQRNLSKTNRDLLKALSQKNAALSQKNAALEKKDAALEEKNAALEKKNAALEERDAALEKKNAALEERDAALEKKDAALEQAKAMLREAGLSESEINKRLG